MSSNLARIPWFPVSTLLVCLSGLVGVTMWRLERVVYRARQIRGLYDPMLFLLTILAEYGLIHSICFPPDQDPHLQQYLGRGKVAGTAIFTMLIIFPIGLLLHSKRRDQITFTITEKWLSVGIFAAAVVFAIMASNSSMDGIAYLALVCLTIGGFAIYAGSMCHRVLPFWIMHPYPTEIVYRDEPQHRNEVERLLAVQSPEEEIVPNPFFKNYRATAHEVIDRDTSAHGEPQRQNHPRSISTTAASSASITSAVTSNFTDSSLTTSTQPQSEVCQTNAMEHGLKSALVSDLGLALSYLAIVLFTAGTSVSISALLPDDFHLRQTTSTEILLSSIYLIPVLVITCIAGYRGVGTVVTNMSLNVLYLNLTFLFHIIPPLPQDGNIPRPRGMRKMQSIAVVIAGFVFMWGLCLEKWPRATGLLLLTLGLVSEGLNVYEYVGGGFDDDS